jgi:hypothetical protein
LQRYRQRAAVENACEIRRHPASLRYSLIAAYCWLRAQDPEEVPLEGVVSSGWRELILMPNKQGHLRVDRLKYELCVLQVLRERLRCKEIWVVGANRYRNPDEDLPTDFELQRDQYYAALNLPQEVENFLGGVQRESTPS